MTQATPRRSVLLFLAGALVALAGCDRPTGTPGDRSAAGGGGAPVEATHTAPPPPAQPERAGGDYRFNAYAYDCGGLQVVVEPREEAMTVYLPDGALLLPQVRAASGARYAEGDAGFWGKGINTATLTLGGEDVPCRLDRQRTPWEAARLRGVAFRAVGQEPGWLIEIGPDEIEIQYDYGQSRVVAPFRGEGPRPGDDVWAFTSEAEGLAVSLAPTACTDPMSGAEFPWTARVILGDRQLAGCGRILESR